MFKILLLGLGACLYTGMSWAGDVAVSDAWIRATAPGQDSAAVAMHITSKKDAQIVGVKSSACDKAEIHSMVHENGMMKMRAMDALELKAGQETELGGNGNHLMLTGLKKSLQAGEHVAVVFTVQFANRHKEKITVQAEVRTMNETHDEQMHMNMNMDMGHHN